MDDPSGSHADQLTPSQNGCSVQGYDYFKDYDYVYMYQKDNHFKLNNKLS